MTALSSAFAQLCHKAQTIFQNNAKLEVRMGSLLGPNHTNTMSNIHSSTGQKEH